MDVKVPYILLLLTLKASSETDDADLDVTEHSLEHNIEKRETSDSCEDSDEDCGETQTNLNTGGGTAQQLATYTQCLITDYVGEEKPKDLKDKMETGTDRGYLVKMGESSIGCCGVISDWSFMARALGILNLQVWRPTGSGYKLVGQHTITVIEDSSGDELKYFPNIYEQITVIPNDLIGWRTEGLDIIPYKEKNDHNYLRETNMLNVNVGSSFSFSGTSISDRWYAIRANLAPGTTPTFSNVPASVTISHYRTIGSSAFYTLAGADSDAGDILSYSIVSQTASYFEVNSTSGELFVTSAMTSGDVSITTRVTDLCGLYSQEVLTVKVTNEIPVFSNLPGSTNVHEDTSQETQLYIIYVSDPDSESVTCSISAMSEVSAPFLLKYNSTNSEYSIFLKASPNLSYDITNQYTITIMCTDGTNPISDDVIVYLQRNAPPTISNLPATVTVQAKTTSKGHSIYNVSVSDVDSASLDIAMVCNGISCPFVISPDGSITTNKSLSDETTSTYTLQVSVNDGKNSVGPVTLSVNLHDLNNAPVFVSLQSTVYLSELTSVGTVILTGSVEDQDIIDTVTLGLDIQPLSGNALFHLNFSNNILMVSTGAAIDYETSAAVNFTLTFTISDGIFSTQGMTDIVVYDENEAPSFSTSTYYISAPEGKKNDVLPTAGFIINDQDVIDTHTYTLHSSSSSDKFTINPSTGAISFGSDYDVDPIRDPSHVTLVVLVTDRGGLSSTCTVDVTISNVNAKPTFINLPRYISVTENLSPGSSVYTISTLDKDTNDVLTISKIWDTFALSTFDFNVSGSTVLLKQALDYELIQSYNLTFVIDDGTEQSEPSTLIINVIDVNEAPQFSNQIYSITDNEGKKDTDIQDIGFNVQDVDAGDHIVFSIKDGNAHGKFKINGTTGRISFATDVEVEQTETYGLVIEATDQGGLSTTTQLNITIQNVNQSPNFVNLPQSMSVPEDLSSGTTLYVVSATDIDTQDVVSLHKIWDSASLSVFILVSGSIVLKTDANLDYEAYSFYNLTFVADDGKGGLSNAALLITIMDVNEPPTFLSNTYYITSDPGKTGEALSFIPLSFFDPDVDDSHTYSLEQTTYSDYFNINSTSGQIYFGTDNVAVAIQYSTILKVKITDKYSKYDLCNVSVTINRVNTPPSVTNLPSVVSIPESISSGSWVYTIQTEDADGDAVNFRIIVMPSSGDGKFLISTIGSQITVTVKSPLDYEHVHEYNISVTANDGTVDSSTEYLHIVVTDVNEAPYFVYDNYVVDITEDKALKDTSIDFIPVLNDDDQSDIHTYSVVAGNEAAYFNINVSSGVISFTNDFDVDQSVTPSNINLSITATDLGGSSALTSVIINIQDVNDNSPNFQSREIIIPVSKYELIGSVIETVTANDADSGMNAEIKMLINQSSDELFAVSHAGQIYLMKSLENFQDGTVFNFIIVAEDKGSPSLSSECLIKVIIQGSASVQALNSGTVATATVVTPASTRKFFEEPENAVLFAASVFGVLSAAMTGIFLVKKAITRKHNGSEITNVRSTDFKRNDSNRIDVQECEQINESRKDSLYRKRSTPNPPIRKPQMHRTASIGSTSNASDDLWTSNDIKNRDKIPNDVVNLRRFKIDENKVRAISPSVIRLSPAWSVNQNNRTQSITKKTNGSWSPSVVSPCDFV